jgi:hypothetical protein
MLLALQKPDFLGAFCSGSVVSAPVVSMSMSVALRRAKKLRLNTDFGGSSSAAEIGTGLLSLNLSLMLRPTVSRPVCLGIKPPSEACDQILITVRQLRVC